MDFTKLSTYDYFLPEELIAQSPAEKRDNSRLLVINKETGNREHKHFFDILDYLKEGDCLVINNTRVIPARIFGKNPRRAGEIETVLLSREKVSGNVWQCLVKPGKKARIGDVIEYPEGLSGKILNVIEDGVRLIEFNMDTEFYSVLDKIGAMPLPPYITKKLEDKERYQTVYALHKGSAAAPTAGLHFTNELLARIKEKGVEVVEILLHVGLGTFRPVKEENILDHKMHKEYIEVTQEAADKINNVRKKGGRVIAVGTTSCRTLESVADENRVIHAYSGDTGIFIYPGYTFKGIDALITNFHLPQSTLLMLISAFAGYDNAMNAYREAVEKQYRFFSFGDAMLII
ncbi:MAG: tRNA preQ1(34) S-adenosylmethionine ribosyltransferase-isomerase QueA [Ruminococcaceae bacterium]|nr:tRNA preQ1(34) S-adenosylmethionine ribosyltransferase-isomerase QueA [Oscillospiraceae bacterium]